MNRFSEKQVINSLIYYQNKTEHQSSVKEKYAGSGTKN